MAYILNSGFKPLGCTPLQQMKDGLKVQLRAQNLMMIIYQNREWIFLEVVLLNYTKNDFFIDILYIELFPDNQVSWWSHTLWFWNTIGPFLTTRLIIDKTTIPLADVAIHHLLALEVYDTFSLSFFEKFYLIHFLNFTMAGSYVLKRSIRTLNIENAVMENYTALMRTLPDSPRV